MDTPEPLERLPALCLSAAAAGVRPRGRRSPAQVLPDSHVREGTLRLRPRVWAFHMASYGQMALRARLSIGSLPWRLGDLSSISLLTRTEKYCKFCHYNRPKAL